MVAGIRGIRARKDEDKAARRAAILREALAAWSESSFGAITMAGIAQRTGLAKGTLYLYFATKEELFLALVRTHLEAWFDDVDARLAKLRAPAAPQRVGKVICESIEQHETMTRLLAILAAVLEHNVAHEAALDFKRLLLERMTETGQRLERALGFLKPGEGAAVLLEINALVVGIRLNADTSPVVREVLSDPALAALRVDFNAALRHALPALLAGHAARESG